MSWILNLSLSATVSNLLPREANFVFSTVNLEKHTSILLPRDWQRDEPDGPDTLGPKRSKEQRRALTGRHTHHLSRHWLQDLVPT